MISRRGKNSDILIMILILEYWRLCASNWARAQVYKFITTWCKSGTKEIFIIEPNSNHIVIIIQRSNSNNWSFTQLIAKRNHSISLVESYLTAPAGEISLVFSKFQR